VIDVCLEVGARRVFAASLDWPGWCRGARTEGDALQALFDYGPRYAKVLAGKRLGFVRPQALSDLRVVERLRGDATTDFGAPSQIAAADRRKIDDRELKRLQAILRACWSAFDKAAEEATGKALRKGPRGGGRTLEAIVGHVTDAEAGYLVRIGGTHRRGAAVRDEVMEAIEAAPRTGTPPPGPRGGVRVPLHFHARRSAWHALDHAWEIADRVEPA
jgi:hypothetical protein